jgi:hypothetical protein
MMAKTRLGCLPIRLETARYLVPRLPEEERYCLVYRNFSNPSNNPILDHVESEIHYLFSCAAYRAERDEWLSKLTLPPDFDLMPTDWKLKVALNDPLNVKLTSKFITNAYNIRSKIGPSGAVQTVSDTDTRIVPLGSGGAILDLDWFLNYRDIKLVIQSSDIEGKDDCLAYFIHGGYFSFWVSLTIEVIP